MTPCLDDVLIRSVRENEQKDMYLPFCTYCPERNDIGSQVSRLVKPGKCHFYWPQNSRRQPWLRWLIRPGGHDRMDMSPLLCSGLVERICRISSWKAVLLLKKYALAKVGRHGAVNMPRAYCSATASWSYNSILSWAALHAEKKRCYENRNGPRCYCTVLNYQTPLSELPRLLSDVRAVWNSLLMTRSSMFACSLVAFAPLFYSCSLLTTRHYKPY